MQGNRCWVSSLLMVRYISYISRYIAQLREQALEHGEQGSERSGDVPYAPVRLSETSHHMVYESLTNNLHSYLSLATNTYEYRMLIHNISPS